MTTFENLIAYLEIKEERNPNQTYKDAIKDIDNWFNPNFEPDVDYEEIVTHIATKSNIEL